MEELTGADRDILSSILCHGDNVPTNIAENIDKNPKYVSQRLKDLDSRNLVSNKGRGVWTLTDKGLAVARQLD